MTVKFQYFEPFPEERAIAAKEKAERVFTGQYKDFEEAMLVLRLIISDYYGMPFFDPYFDKRSLDDLVFEAEIIQLKRKPPSQHTSDLIRKNKEETDQLFNDFAEEDGFVSVPEPPVDDEAFKKISEKFMSDGNFTE